MINIFYSAPVRLIAGLNKMENIKVFRNAEDVATLKRAVFNREPDEHRYKRMAQELLSGKVKIVPPVLIGETEDGSCYILDGQHRIEALKLVWAEGSEQSVMAFYIKCPYSELRDTIIALNKRETMKAWTNRQYAESLKNNGNNAMIELYNFAEGKRLLKKKNGQLSLRNLGYIVYGRNIDKDIIAGTLTVTKEQLDTAYLIYDEVEQLIKRLDFHVNNWTSGMIQGWRMARLNENTGKMIDEIGFTTYVKKFKEKASFGKKMLSSFGYREWQEKFELAARKLYEDYKKSA